MIFCFYSRFEEEYLNYLKQVMCILRKEKLYINMEKCSFMEPKMIFLEFLLSSTEWKVDSKPTKVRYAPMLINVHEVLNFSWTCYFIQTFQ